MDKQSNVEKEKRQPIKRELKQDVSKHELKGEDAQVQEPNPFDDLRYLDLSTLNVMKDHIYKANKEAFDIFFTINAAIEKNRLVGKGQNQ